MCFSVEVATLSQISQLSSPAETLLYKNKRQLVTTTPNMLAKGVNYKIFCGGISALEHARQSVLIQVAFIAVDSFDSVLPCCQEQRLVPQHPLDI